MSLWGTVIRRGTSGGAGLAAEGWGQAPITVSFRKGKLSSYKGSGISN